MALQSVAQVHQAWVNRYAAEGTAKDVPVAIALDTQHQIIVGGNAIRTNGLADFIVLKIGPEGALSWKARHEPANADTNGMKAMAIMMSGNIVLTGHPATVKYSSDGTKKWQLAYGGRALAVDLGETNYITGLNSADFVTVKVAPNGSNVWTRSFDYRGLSDVSFAVALEGENVYVGGAVGYYCDIIHGVKTSCYWQCGLLKYTSNGELEWNAVFPIYEPLGTNAPQLVSAILADPNCILFVGNFVRSPAFRVSKFAHNGELVWDKTISPYTSSGAGVSIAKSDAFGNVYLTGWEFESQLPSFPWSRNYAVKTYKVRTDGEVVWSASYWGNKRGLHRANAIAIDTAGNVYVTGQSPGIGTGNDYATIKYSPSGQELWVQRYDGPAHGDDVATAIAVAPDGSVYVTGWSTTSSNLIEITTIKYTQSASLTVETNRNVNLQFPGTPGATNRVQATTDFLGWLDLGFTVADTNGLIHFIDTNAPSFPFRFYRTVTP